MTDRQHPQTPDDLADEILRYIARYRKVFGRPVRSVQFTVKFKGSVTEPRQQFWSVESDMTHHTSKGCAMP